MEIIGCDVNLPALPLVPEKRNLGNTLQMGQMMYAGDHLVSDNGEYTLIGSK